MTDQPWASPDRPVTERVNALLAAMTLEEKVGQLHQVGNADAVRDAAALAAGSFGSCIMGSGEQAGNVRDSGVHADRVNALQRAAVETSRLGIPLLIARDVIHGHRTVFPIPLGQAASFDAELVRLCARATAREASADGVRWTFAPMVDIAHDPRWGRVAESWGEDPWLSAHLGAAAIEGFQGGPGGSGLAEPDSLAACAKHYVGYGLVQGGRDYAEVDVGPVTLHDRHMRPFAAAVDAGVATVMTAFHTLDRTPMTAHAGLVRGHLKSALGFAGVVVSDWDAVGELLLHGVASDTREAAALALLAGVDIDMASGAYRAHLAGLVRSGQAGRGTRGRRRRAGAERQGRARALREPLHRPGACRERPTDLGPPCPGAPGRSGRGRAAAQQRCAASRRRTGRRESPAHHRATGHRPS